MRVNGLIVSYENGINTILEPIRMQFPVGSIPCMIFQGETIDNITRILWGCINGCPMKDDLLSSKGIEDAEHYILEILLYDDFIPAQRIAQGSFIRIMEFYRAIDPSTVDHILQIERTRAAESDLLPYKDVGVETIGSFLRLCFNNYVIDLENALELFTSMAAVRSESANEDELQHYRDICNALRDSSIIPGIEMRTSYNSDDGSFSYRYVLSSFLALTVFEFSHMCDAGVKIRRCRNPECKKFFTAKSKKAMYCSFPSPQQHDRRCSEYYPQISYRLKQKRNDALRLEKNALGRLYNDKRRNPIYKDEINRLIQEIQIQSPGKRLSIAEGTLPLHEYKSWLDTFRRSDCS